MKKRWLIVALVSLMTMLTGCTMKSNDASHVQHPAEVKVKQIKQKKKYQVTEQNWIINQDGVSIYGRLYLPQNLAGKKKAVILAHGLAGNHRDLANYAKNLASQGYLAYVFDFPGGAKNGLSSGVNQLQMSIFTEERNLRTVLNAVKNRSDVKSKQVSLLGESQGGAVAAMLASKYSKEVKSLILLYPAFSITDYAQAAFGSVDKVPKTLNLFGFTVGQTYFEKLFKYNLLKSATKYPGPVLLIHGQADIIVPETYSEKAAKKFKHAKLYTFRHAGHDFKGKYQKQAFNLIDRFLKKN